MTKESEIYNEIAQILIATAPKNAKKILMAAQLAENGDAGFMSRYWSDDDVERSFFIDGTEEIRVNLVFLREFYAKNNQPPWNTCDFWVDVINGEFKMKLYYENPE